MVSDLQEHAAELKAAQAGLEDLRRRALDAGSPQAAAQTAGKLAAVQQKAAAGRPGTRSSGACLRRPRSLLAEFYPGTVGGSAQ